MCYLEQNNTLRGRKRPADLLQLRAVGFRRHADVLTERDVELVGAVEAALARDCLHGIIRFGEELTGKPDPVSQDFFHGCGAFTMMRIIDLALRSGSKDRALLATIRRREQSNVRNE